MSQRLDLNGKLHHVAEALHVAMATLSEIEQAVTAGTLGELPGSPAAPRGTGPASYDGPIYPEPAEPHLADEDPSGTRADDRPIFDQTGAPHGPEAVGMAPGSMMPGAGPLPPWAYLMPPWAFCTPAMWWHAMMAGWPVGPFGMGQQPWGGSPAPSGPAYPWFTPAPPPWWQNATAPWPPREPDAEATHERGDGATAYEPEAAPDGKSGRRATDSSKESGDDVAASVATPKPDDDHPSTSEEPAREAPERHTWRWSDPEDHTREMPGLFLERVTTIHPTVIPPQEPG